MYLFFRLVNKISIFFTVLLLISCNGAKRDLNPKELIGGLELLTSEQTGIDFNNSIKESELVNHIYYSQIYNGAGIATGDINNDGLPDLFFCGNQVTDKLYLNKGDFKFEDISKKSRITRSPGWSWGVTMADVNNDGFLDIYVSRNGESMNPSDRKNKLFINNKDLTFTESAQKYGLADEGFSSQAVFFDMDNDGDLDMYQVNQLPDQRLFSRYKNIPKERYSRYQDKLYENLNGKYVEISKKAGLVNRYSYGLSVSASDLNNDGFTDLYIANDYDEPDLLYYNNGDGTFKNVINEKLKHISRFSMGTDTGDLNNDGFIDLITLDMAAEDHYRSKTNMKSMNSKEFDEMIKKGDHYQYMFNTLQINNGFGEFSDIANMAGIGKTDWSWGGLLVDLDNDGFKDIVVSNGIKKDIRNNDFLTDLYKKLETKSQDFYKMAKLAPSNPLANYIYKNKNGFEFENVTEKWGFDMPTFSHGVAYADLDNDGDLDLVLNNMESSASIYKNKATGNFLKFKLEGSNKNKFGYGAKVKIYYDTDKSQISENTVTRGYFSSIEPKVFFGLGNTKEIDKVEITWPDGQQNILKEVTVNQEVVVKYSAAKKNQRIDTASNQIFSNVNSNDLGLDFKHKENDFNEYEKEILLPHNISQNGPFSSIADVNGDNLEDIFIGGAFGQQGILYLQTNNSKFLKSKSQPWVLDKNAEDLEALFFDVDADGDKDLYVTSGGSEYEQGNKNLKDRLYVNDGLGNFKKSKNAIPNIFESTQSVKASDIDADGDLDLFIGTRLIAGKYPFPGTSYFLINDKGVFKKASNKIALALQNIGMVTDAVFSDIDNDGDDDLLIVGEWMKIKVLENKKGIFKDSSKKFGIEEISRGLWWSITASDIDNDGDEDYIIGNLGKNNKFKASKEHPFKIYANDFDNNGTNDVVLAKYYKNDYVPMRGKECSTQQMPYLSDKFKDYHSFASSKLIDILPKDKINDAVIYEISNFESILLINENGKLKKQSLPIETQVSTIKDALVEDFNKDGDKDILLVGNHLGVEIETTRYDASFGQLLLGLGNNKFKVTPIIESGLNISSDSRSLHKIKLKDKNVILVTNNKDSLNLLKY